jgi:hypothetical protein
MVFNFFGFARKRRRTHRKRRRTHRKRRTTRHRSVRRTAIKSKKPTKTFLNLCKKYGIKVSVKSGGKRRYKKISVLKKQCAKKIRSLIKNHPDRRKQKTRRSRFGGVFTNVKKAVINNPRTVALALAGAAYTGRLVNAQHQGQNKGNSDGARKLFNDDVGKIKSGAKNFSEGVRRELTPNFEQIGSHLFFNSFL